MSGTAEQVALGKRRDNRDRSGRQQDRSGRQQDRTGRKQVRVQQSGCANRAAKRKKQEAASAVAAALVELADADAPATRVDADGCGGDGHERCDYLLDDCGLDNYGCGLDSCGLCVADRVGCQLVGC